LYLGRVDSFGVDGVLQQGDVELDGNVGTAGDFIATWATRQKISVWTVLGILDCNQSVTLHNGAGITLESTEHYD